MLTTCSLSPTVWRRLLLSKDHSITNSIKEVVAVQRPLNHQQCEGVCPSSSWTHCPLPLGNMVTHHYVGFLLFVSCSNSWIWFLSKEALYVEHLHDIDSSVICTTQCIGQQQVPLGQSLPLHWWITCGFLVPRLWQTWVKPPCHVKAIHVRGALSRLSDSYARCCVFKEDSQSDVSW